MHAGAKIRRHEHAQKERAGWIVVHRRTRFRYPTGIGQGQPPQGRHQQNTAYRAEGNPLLAPVHALAHEYHCRRATGNAQTDAHEVNAKLAAMIVANQPVQDEAGPQQHAGRAGQTRKVARHGPHPEIGCESHHQGSHHRHHHADAKQPVLQHQIADRGRDQRSGQVTAIVDRCQPAALGQAQPGLLLHQRQQRRIGEARHAQSKDQAEDAGTQHLHALNLISHVFLSCHLVGSER